MTDSKRIYIDTAPYIYYIEKNPVYCDRVKRFFISRYESNYEFVTSVITEEEYSIVPYRDNNQKLLDDFEMFIKDTQTEVVDITKEVARKAAMIRAAYKNFKAMDALQLAAAILSECSIFLTNDKQLRQYQGLKVMTMEDL